MENTLSFFWFWEPFPLARGSIHFLYGIQDRQTALTCPLLEVDRHGTD